MISNSTTRERAPRESLINPPPHLGSHSLIDHEGHPAISAYWGSQPRPGTPILPPIWSYHYYITFGATAETAPTLPEALVLATMKPISGVMPFRLDVYFLPGASTNACIKHYCGEKASRKTALPPNNFFHSYSDPYSTFNLFVQIGAADWESKEATMVTFDRDSAPADGDAPIEANIQRNLLWGDLNHPQDTVGNELQDLVTDEQCVEMTDAYRERLCEGLSAQT
jgi:hypothetical protein